MVAASFLAVNDKVWRSLPGDIQAGLQAAADEFGPYNDKAAIEGDKRGIVALKAAGATVANANVDEYRKLMTPIYEHFGPAVGGVNRITEFIAAQ